MIQSFENKVAVITGGAHGIGFALAQECLSRGMKVVITASRQSSLDEAIEKLKESDRLLCVHSDASDPDANLMLADMVKIHFGSVHLLVLNAGISRLQHIQDISIEQWRKTMGINLDGPFYGVKAFLPILEQQQQAHIVLTGSVFSYITAGLQAPYFTSKAGLASFAESLFFDLKAEGSKVGVSLLCPGNTATNMAESGLTGDESPELAQAIRAEVASGTAPSQVATATLDAVEKNQFYIFPNTGDFQAAIDERFDRITSQRNPRLEDVSETL